MNEADFDAPHAIIDLAALRANAMAIRGRLAPGTRLLAAVKADGYGHGAVTVARANVRFRDDAQVGWQSDRGTAYVALGDPDNIIDTGMIDPNARVRQQIWEYRELRIQLNFVDQTGFGRWRLNTQGRADLDAAIRRKLALQQR